jgi:hypothetical protein
MLIGVTCDECHASLKLKPNELVLAVPPHDAEGKPAGELLFACPRCHETAWRSVFLRTIALLTVSGVSSIPLLEAEDLRPAYPEQRPWSAIPMSLDDLLDLHRLLEMPDWLSG